MPRLLSSAPPGPPGGAERHEGIEGAPDLERRILARPLPWRVLARPRNAAFLSLCLGKALLLLVRLHLQRVESLFPPPPGRTAPVSVEKAAIAHVLADRLLRSPFVPVRRTCLRRSLLLANLLRESGIETTICFGVRDRGGRLEGHSWLTREGRPFLETEETWREYACVFTLPRIE